MKAEEVKVGATVILNSGGPLMTISSINQDDVDCVWFVDRLKQKGTFNAATLKLQTPLFDGYGVTKLTY